MVARSICSCAEEAQLDPRDDERHDPGMRRIQDLHPGRVRNDPDRVCQATRILTVQIDIGGRRETIQEHC